MATGAPPAYEALWVNDLLRELPWRVSVSRLLGGDVHINVRELRAALRHGIAEAGRRRSLKLLMILDSRVAGGAMGKGCSSPPRSSTNDLLYLSGILVFLLDPPRIWARHSYNLGDTSRDLRQRFA